MVKIEVIFNKKNKEIYLNPKKWKDLIFHIILSEKSEEMRINLFLIKNIMDAVKHEDRETLSINMSRSDVIDSLSKSGIPVHQKNLEEFLYILASTDADAKKFSQNTELPKLIREMKEFFKEIQDNENLQNILNKIEDIEK